MSHQNLPPQPPQYGQHSPVPHGPPPPRPPGWPNWFARHKVLTVVFIVFGVLVVGVGAASESTEDSGNADGQATTQTDDSHLAKKDEPKEVYLTAIQEAAKECKVRSAVGDHGRSITLATDGVGRVSIADVACVALYLGMPDSTVSRIDSTSALMGVQEDSWDDYIANWSYHPDSGLLLIIEEEGMF